MEKIKLEELAPYLPYGLMFYVEHANGDQMEPWEMNIDTDLRSVLEYQNKPILRLLSDIWTEYPNEEGRYFDQMKVYSDGSNHMDEWLDHLVDFYDKVNEVDFQQCPYAFIVFLFENHFDVFGLIDRGLAIDINTLKP